MPDFTKYIWMLDVLLITFSYIFFALVFYFWIYKYNQHKWIQKKNNKRIVQNKQLKREFFLSVLTMIIYAGIGYAINQLQLAGYTKVYLDFNNKPIGYFLLSIVLMVFLHDVYFYWSHRFLHIPSIFRMVHRVHHLSNQPTPWSAFAFHPVEALIQGAFIPLLVFIIPSHPIAIFIFLFYMTFINVAGHCGYEILPEKFRKNALGKFHNSPSYHDQHHSVGGGHYGLYFTFWDRLMNTFSEKEDSTPA